MFKKEPFNQRRDLIDYITPAKSLPPGHEFKWPIWKSLDRLKIQLDRSRDGEMGL